ncbi:MAG TPA: succinic semialdehyde dehydrogenase [Dermatophilaceae bacterium]|nr:succinic semialdehyde dehydrogenase [Dermatophilaceae bacterium]
MTQVLTDASIEHSATIVEFPGGDHRVDPKRVARLARRVVAGPDAEQSVSICPMTGQPLATLPVSTPEDVTVAMSAARAAQRGWAALPVQRRAAVLLRFHDLVLEHESELMDLIQLEAGKARRHAFEEIADCAIVARHYGRRASAYLSDTRHLGALPVLTQTVEAHHPKGVVGIISPWNYPLSLAITDALPALVAGNAVVLRPDQKCRVTALAGMELLVEAGLPQDVVQIVLGPGGTTGQAVVEQADYVCFTGSTPTGRRIAETAARRLIGYSLELGGKNTMYIADDAHLDRAVEGAVRGCFSSAGQLCISAERLVVHERIHDAFVGRFIQAVEAMRIGTELRWGIDMGSLVGQEQLELVSAHVEDARAKGATVLTGGRARPDLGPFCYEPTVLEGVTPQMRCRDEETFGPVVSIYPVASDDEAVAIANDTDYGLNASVWTRDGRRGRELARRIHSGTVNVNEAYAAAWGSVGAPMGGMKDSGVGRRHGREGILKYTESQNIAVQRITGFGGLPGMSDQRFAALLNTSLKVMKMVRLP